MVDTAKARTVTAAPRAIRPARPGLDVVVRVPGSKSVTNRALLLAALSDGESILRGALVADDTLAFIDGLRSLGFAIVEDASGRLRVRGADGRVPISEASVWCADAGTAARFLLALCAAGHGRFNIDASAQMRRRPMGPLLEALRAQGAAFEPADAVSLPVTVVAGGLAGGSVTLPGDVSSQFVSALLMAAPLARAPLGITVDTLVSRPYVDMTLAMMAQFGVEAEREGYASFQVQPATYRAREYDIEPDASTASYFFAAAAITGGRVTVPGLRRRDGLQGDVRFVDALEAMGCRVAEGDAGLTVEGPRVGDTEANAGTGADAGTGANAGAGTSAGTPAAPAPLRGLTVDMADISDTFMTLAAIAPLASSPVTITGIANVRLKESDRIAAMEDGLRRAGVRTESGPDHLRVLPGAPHGARIDPHGDHRIAMSFSVLGLRTPGIVVEDPACVRKTCPTFFDLWGMLEATD